jgi:hypothetical protein
MDLLPAVPDGCLESGPTALAAQENGDFANNNGPRSEYRLSVFWRVFSTVQAKGA